MAESARERSPRHYLDVVRRQWRIVVAGVLIGLLATIAYLAINGFRQSAQTDVNINVISTEPFNGQRSASTLVDGSTEVQIATSHAVASRVSEQLGLTATQLRDALEVDVIPNATVVRLHFSADSAEAARTGADAIAGAYLDYRSEQAQERLDGILDRIGARLADLQERLLDANTRAAAAEPGSQASNQAISDRDFITIELDSLLTQKTAAESVDTSGGSILSSAAENEVTTLRPITLLAGPLAGLVLGLIAAFVRDGLRRRVLNAADVEHATGIRVLAEFPGGPQTLPAGAQALDATRVARERILAAFDPRGSTLLVVDDAGSSDVSAAAVTLALAFAEVGRPTRLVLPGLADARTRDVSAALSGTPALQVTAPPVTPSEGDLVHAVTPELLTLVEGTPADSLTIVVLPSHADRSSRIAAARVADASVAVVAAGASRADRIGLEIDEMLDVGGVFLGAIVTRQDSRLVVETAPPPRPRRPSTSAKRPPPAAPRARRGVSSATST